MYDDEKEGLLKYYVHKGTEDGEINSALWNNLSEKGNPLVTNGPTAVNVGNSSANGNAEGIESHATAKNEIDDVDPVTDIVMQKDYIKMPDQMMTECLPNDGESHCKDASKGMIVGRKEAGNGVLVNSTYVGDPETDQISAVRSLTVNRTAVKPYESVDQEGNLPRSGSDNFYYEIDETLKFPTEKTSVIVHESDTESDIGKETVNNGIDSCNGGDHSQANHQSSTNKLNTQFSNLTAETPANPGLDNCEDEGEDDTKIKHGYNLEFEEAHREDNVTMGSGFSEVAEYSCVTELENSGSSNVVKSVEGYIEDVVAIAHDEINDEENFSDEDFSDSDAESDVLKGYVTENYIDYIAEDKLSLLSSSISETPNMHSSMAGDVSVENTESLDQSREGSVLDQSIDNVGEEHANCNVEISDIVKTITETFDDNSDPDEEIPTAEEMRSNEMHGDHCPQMSVVKEMAEAEDTNALKNNDLVQTNEIPNGAMEGQVDSGENSGSVKLYVQASITNNSGSGLEENGQNELLTLGVKHDVDSSEIDGTVETTHL